MTKVPLMNQFLFCFSLKTGSKVIGYAQVIINALLTILTTYFTIVLIRDETFTDFPPGMLKSISEIYFEAICGVFLLMGVYWDKPAYIKAWVVIQCAFIVQAIANISTLSILSLEGYSFIWRYLVFKFSALLLDVFYTIVVYSYYRKNYYRDSYGTLLSDDFFDTLE